MTSESNRMTSCGLNNSGFLLFGTDIEMGDPDTFNTTGSRLWQRVVLLFQEELKAEYALMRQGRFTVDNIMSYLYGEQISQIPATYYNRDMQTKYLDFGSAYLYALHGSGEKHLKRWIRERLMYVDTLLGYMVSSSDYITIRSNKLGYVYLDIQMYIPMYVTVKWRDEAGGTGIQTKRVGKGETVRFEYTMPTATDQEILVYAGHYIKSLGDLTNLQPSTLLIANANRLTEITCHSDNLINTDLSECKLLQKIDISDCIKLGTGIGAQPILNIEKAKYLRYLDCRNTQLTAIYTMQSGSNLEEIYYPESVQTVELINQAYLKVVGIPYRIDEETGNVIKCENLADVKIDTCKNVEYMQYPYVEGDYVNLSAIKHVQNLTLINSLDKLDSMSFEGFNKLKTLTLSTMHNINSLGFDDMLSYSDTASLESIKVSDCPLIDKVTFNMTNISYKVEFVENAKIDLGGMQSVKTIESNASIKGLKTLIIPTSLKELKFTAELGDGTTSIVNVWSAAANHANDGFEGMDLLDISLEYLDMDKLINVGKAINFHITPTEQHPNMNTSRTDKFFKPEGSINLSNYTGSMVGMLKGVDLSKLDIIIDKNQYQPDLTGLFENAILDAQSIEKINMILSKYIMANNWSKLFKNADVKFSSLAIDIPDETTRRNMNLSEMFYNTSVSDDIVMTKNIINVSNMFRDCKNMRSYQENWNKTLYSEIVTDDCYKGTGGDLDFVPTIWGGYGFFPDVTTIAVINVPTSDYTVKISARNRTTTTYGIVNWGDGTINSLYDVDYSHTFAYPGVYTIKGHYSFGLGNINHSSVNNTLIEVTQMPTNITNLSSAFKYCSKLESVNMGELQATNLKDTFSECANLINVDISGLNTENVSNMSGMFMNCKKLKNIDMSGFVTDKVTNMNSMFNGCAELIDLDLSNFNTEALLDMSNMFGGCESLTSLNVSTFDTSNVTNMNSLFYNCKSLPVLEISNFNTEQVENMSYMFYKCSKLETLDVSNIYTPKVNNMKYMFAYCENLSSLDILHFTTDIVNSLEGMFCGCSDIVELDLSNFTTNNVESTLSMFENCISLKIINLLNWDTSSVKTLDSMFEGCKQLAELNIDHFNTEQVENMNSMFKGCSSLLSLNLNNFNTTKVEDMESMFESCTNLGGLDLSSFNTSRVTSMRQMFYNCNNLSELNVSSFDTINVKSLLNMFYNCKKVGVLDVSGFNTSKVTDMGGLFYGCNNITEIDVSKFDTGNVENMEHMFYGCINLYSIPLSGWDTKSVKNMGGMFYSCVKLYALDLSTWVTDKVTDMYNMFHSCSLLTEIKMDNFDTSNVTNMGYMFHNCEKLAGLDISHFDTRNVTNMRNMFYGCSSLTDLDLSHLDTSKVTNMSYMLCNLRSNVKFNNKVNNALKNTTSMFNIFYGNSIDMTNFSLANSTNNTQFIAIAPNLVDFIPPTNINTSIKVLAENLSVDSLKALIENLGIVTKPQHLEIGSSNIAKLTDEEIAVAINKGWSVS